MTLLGVCAIIYVIFILCKKDSVEEGYVGLIQTGSGNFDGGEESSFYVGLGIPLSLVNAWQTLYVWKKSGSLAASSVLEYETVRKEFMTYYTPAMERLRFLYDSPRFDRVSIQLFDYVTDLYKTQTVP